MKLTNAHKTAILDAALAHTLLLGAATEMFHWFQTAVAGETAEHDIEEKLEELSASLAEGESLPQRLANEWSSFASSLKDAYQNFGRDVVTRHGLDNPDQVRNLALSIAASAFARVRDNSRQHLISRVEAAPQS